MSNLIPIFVKEIINQLKPQTIMKNLNSIFDSISFFLYGVNGSSIAETSW
jgi:hypothetical protein